MQHSDVRDLASETVVGSDGEKEGIKYDTGQSRGLVMACRGRKNRRLHLVVTCVVGSPFL